MSNSRKTPPPIKPAAKKSMASARQPGGGVPMWALLLFGGIVGVFVVVIAGLSVVLALALMGGAKPIAEVKREAPINPGEGAEKPRQAGPIDDPVKPIARPDPEPPVVERKPTEVVGDAEWRVDGDELVVNNPTLKRAYLYFGSTAWTDYDFSFEANSAARTSGALAAFRAAGANNHYGFSLAAFLRGKHMHTLSRVEKGVLADDVVEFAAPFKLNQWYAVRIEARGSQVRCFVDGKQVFDSKNDVHASGQVALGATPGGQVRWKNIKVTRPDGRLLWDGPPEVPTAQPTPGPAEFAALFNGKDLTGWKTHQDQPGQWRVENGLLVGDATGALLAHRPHGKDFHLRVEAKASDLGVGFLRFRCPDGKILGYQAPINCNNNTFPLVPKIGGLSAQIATGSGTRILAYVSKTPVLPEEWFTLEIMSLGNRLTVLVDGKVSADLLEASEFPAEGRIALVNERGTIAFRKIEIKELKYLPVPPAVLADQFVPLFNGKNLEGWRTHPKQPGEWRVADGVLIGSGAGVGALYTVREDYQDFHLRVEVRINQGGHGAVFCRGPFGPMFPAVNPVRPIGFQIDVNNTDRTPNRTGSVSLRRSTSILGNLTAFPAPTGEWFTMEIVAVDNRVTLQMNGKVVMNTIDTEKLYKSGPIALSLEKPGSVLEFRKIEIKAPGPVGVVAAPPPPPPPPAPAEGFVALFNGKDLTGWKDSEQQPGKWRVENGMLIGSATGMLLAERPHPKDFHLRVEAKVSNLGAGYVRFRFPEGKIVGYEAPLNSNVNTIPKTGSLSSKVPVGSGTRTLAWLTKTPIQPEQWFTLEIVTQGNRFTVKVDGQETADAVDVADFPAEGRLGLASALGTIAFRKVEIKELKPVVVVPAMLANEFVPLFNGKDLDGWKTHPRQPGEWRVQDGILIGSSAGFGALYTTREDYQNFHLRLEARVNENGRGALICRAPFGPMNPVLNPTSPIGFLAEINNLAGAANRTGSVHVRRSASSSGSNYPSELAPGDWFTLEILALDNQVSVKLNGKPTRSIADPDKIFRTGAIALSLEKPGSVLEFRKIEIKAAQQLAFVAPPIPPPLPPPVVVDKGFVPLFNGKDLAGLRVEGGDFWRIDGVNGALMGNGPNTAILTKRNDFKDFTLRIELSCASHTEAIFGFRQSAGPQGKWLGLTSRLEGDIATVKAGLAGENSAQAEAGTPFQARAGEKFTLEVIVKNDTMAISANGKATGSIKFAPGAHPPGAIGLFVTKGGVRITKFEIKEDGPAAPVLAAGDWTPLFNGKDLTGWNKHPAFPGNWRVENGTLIGDGQKTGILHTARDDFKDFHLRVEGRFNAMGASSGVLVRSQAGRSGYESLILANKLTDGIYVRGGKTPPKIPQALLANVKGGDWFTLEFIVQGNRLKTLVNGKETGDFVDDAKTFASGQIALRQGTGNSIEFRKIEIKEFNVVAAVPLPVLPPVAVDRDFVPLFNGKDFTGWKKHAMYPGEWKIENGVLSGLAGPKNRGQLETEKIQPKDFHLRVEARIVNANAMGHVSFRGPEGTFIGYESGISSAHAGLMMFQNPGIALRTFPRNQDVLFLPKPGEWFTLELIADGTNLIAKVNGKETTKAVDASILAAGHIGLTTFTQGVIEFRKIEIKDLKPAAVAVAPPPGGQKFEPVGAFVPLFNGKNLNGWQPHLEAAENWRVENGILTGSGAEIGILHTVRADFKDYHLRLEARFTVPDGAPSSGILFHSRAGRTGCETMFLKGKFTGGLYLSGEDFGKPVAAKMPANVPSGEWFTLDFSAQGNRFIVKVNDKDTTDFTDAESLFKSGQIALRHGAGSKLEVRKIELQELKAVAVKAPDLEPAPAKGGFVALFNGKDLAGWQPHAKRPGNWRVENGILVGSAPVGGSLYSTRGDYQDFHLRAELRINDKGFGRILGRAAYDPAKIPFKVLGYEVLLNQRPLGDKTGTLTATSAIATALTQAKESPAPAGDWIQLEIIAREDLVIVKVNGSTVSEFRDEKRQFARTGHIALHQDANATIEFRKVEIEDLGAAKAP